MTRAEVIGARGARERIRLEERGRWQMARLILLESLYGKA